MFVKYVGPDSGTQLIDGRHVEPGEPIEVPDAFGRLLPGVWQPVKKPAAKPQTKE